MWPSLVIYSMVNYWAILKARKISSGSSQKSRPENISHFFPMDLILYIYTQTSSFNISDCALPPCNEATFSGVFWSFQVAWYGKKVCGHDGRSPDLGGVRGCVHRRGQHFRGLSCIVLGRTYGTFFPVNHEFSIFHGLHVRYTDTLNMRIVWQTQYVKPSADKSIRRSKYQNLLISSKRVFGCNASLKNQRVFINKTCQDLGN